MSTTPPGTPAGPASSGAWVSADVIGPGFRAVVGQAVEVEVYGTRMTGTVIRSGQASIVINGEGIRELRRLRLGVQATATFGVDGGAARVEATLGPSREGVVLQFRGPVRFVNRRAHPRAAITVPIDLVWMLEDRSDPVVSAASSLDLSAGGVRMAIESGREIPAEATLALLALQVPTRRLALPARILVVAGTTVRAQFCGPHADDVAAISAMVLQRLVHASPESSESRP